MYVYIWNYFLFFICSPKLRQRALCAVVCFGRAALLFFFISLLLPNLHCCCEQDSRQSDWAEHLSACIKPGLPHEDYHASVTSCLLLTRSKLLCITSSSLLISLISLQVMGFLSISALLALFFSPYITDGYQFNSASLELLQCISPSGPAARHHQH